MGVAKPVSQDSGCFILDSDTIQNTNNCFVLVDASLLSDILILAFWKDMAFHPSVFPLPLDVIGRLCSVIVDIFSTI